MLKNLFRKRLEQKLDTWIAKGWVAADARNAILDDIGGVTSRHAWTRQAGYLAGLLGVLLLSAGLLLFISVNWQEMTRLARLTLVLATMAGALGTGAWLAKSDHRKTGEAGFLLGVVAYGGSIMLVGQMYHIEGDLPDGILLWLSGSLLAAALLRSVAALVLGILLLMAWELIPIIENLPETPHWAFLLPWSIAMLLSIRGKNRVAIHLAVVSGIIWIVFNLPPWIIRHAGYAAAMDFLILLPFIIFLSGLLLETARTATMRLLGQPLLLYGGLCIFLVPDILGMVGYTNRLLFMQDDHREWTVLPYLLAITAVPGLLALRNGNISRANAFVLLLFMAWKIRLGRLIADMLPTSAFMYISTLAAFAFMLWLVIFANRRGNTPLKWGTIVIMMLNLVLLYSSPLGEMLDTSFIMLAGGGLFILIAGSLILLSRKSANGQAS